MDWSALRRIVTTNNSYGKSRVLLDEGPAKHIAVEEAGLAEIWATSIAAGARLLTHDQLSDKDLTLEPADGDVKIRWFTVPVENEADTPDDREAKAAFGFSVIKASHARVDTTRHPMMHKTNSLDVIVLVRGEVDMLLDDGEAKHLKSGDVVIQQATNHAWINRGNETALLVAILVDTHKERVND